MLLPRGRKEMEQSEVGPGFYPPLLHRLSLPDDPELWGGDPSYSMTHIAEAMAKVKVIGQGKKYNLMAQVIPIYGFGILLYIINIIYKLTCKNKTKESGNDTTVTETHVENSMTTNYELAHLQEKLLHAERMMERIVSRKSSASGSGRRRKSKTTTSKKEEKLLRQLRQISLRMQDLEGATPEMEAEEVPYSADWEGYPDETFPEYDDNPSVRRGFDTVTVEVPRNQPTAEALAERMEQEEEDLMARKLSIVHEEDEEQEEVEVEGEEEEDEEEEEEEEENEDEEVEEAVEDVEVVEEVEDEEEEEEEEEEEKRQLLSPNLSRHAAEKKQERLGLEVSKELQCQNGGKKQISFSDQQDVFRYPKEGEEEEEEEEEEEDEEEVEEEDEGTEVEEEEADEDDPVMEAESLLFSCEGCPNPEEEAEEDQEEYLLTSEDDEGQTQADVPKEVSGLRMRNRRET